MSPDNCQKKGCQEWGRMFSLNGTLNRVLCQKHQAEFDKYELENLSDVVDNLSLANYKLDILSEKLARCDDNITQSIERALCAKHKEVCNKKREFITIIQNWLDSE